MMTFQTLISKKTLNFILEMTSSLFHLFILIHLLLNVHYLINYLYYHHFASLMIGSFLICQSSLIDFFYLIVFSLMIFVRFIMKMLRFNLSFSCAEMSFEIFCSLFSLFVFGHLHFQLCLALFLALHFLRILSLIMISFQFFSYLMNFVREDLGLVCSLVSLLLICFASQLFAFSSVHCHLLLLQFYLIIFFFNLLLLRFSSLIPYFYYVIIFQIFNFFHHFRFHLNLHPFIFYLIIFLYLWIFIQVLQMVFLVALMAFAFHFIFLLFYLTVSFYLLTQFSFIFHFISYHFLEIFYFFLNDLIQIHYHFPFLFHYFIYLYMAKPLHFLIVLAIL